MEKSINLTEKILFLAGTQGLLEAKAPPIVDTPTEDIPSEDEENEKDAAESNSKEAIENNKETQIAKSRITDYLKTNEDDYLNFPMKYAMVSTNADMYVNNMNYLFLSLKKKGVPIQRIIQLIAPDKSSSFSPSKYKTLQKSTQEFLKSLENNYQKAAQGEKDGILKLNVGDELDKYNDISLKQKVLAQHDEFGDTIFEQNKEKLKRDFQSATGDEKAVISYGFNRNPNELKLTPLGFWQIQFLSRILKMVPRSQDDLESLFFHSSAFGSYYNKAERVLADFYKHAIYPMATTLTGRAYNINPNDHEFEIMLQGSWDKVKDNIDKYDSSRDNFGAWAFTVARNALIDQIKHIADYRFQNTEEAYNAVITQNLVYLHFIKSMDEKLKDYSLETLNPEIKEDALELKRQAENKTYLYKFKSPTELFEFLQENQGNQSVFRSLSRISRTVLNGLKVLHSVKKNADFFANGIESEKEKEFEIGTKEISKEEKDKLFTQLSNLYSKRTPLSLSYDKLEETNEYRVKKLKDGSPAYSEEDLAYAFDRDLGKAIYFFQSQFVEKFPYWSKTPPRKIKIKFFIYVISLSKKYTKGELEEMFKIKSDTSTKELFKYILSLNKGATKEFLNNTWTFINNITPATLNIGGKKKQRLANALFYKNKDVKGGEVLNMLAPYVSFSETSAIGVDELSSKLKEEFHTQQNEEKARQELKASQLGEDIIPDPVYTFSNPKDSKGIWEQISSKGVSPLNLRLSIEKEYEQEDTKRKLMYKTTEMNNLYKKLLNYEIDNQDYSNKEIKKYVIDFLNSKLAKDIESGETPPINYSISSNDLIKMFNYSSNKSTINLMEELKKDKTFIALIEKVYDISGQVKEYIKKSRYSELKKFSNIFSTLSGENIQFENKETEINEINNYLLEVNKNS